jgi:hypothetical protein
MPVPHSRFAGAQSGTNKEHGASGDLRQKGCPGLPPAEGVTALPQWRRTIPIGQ